MRVRVDNTVIAFEDLLQGRIEQNLAREVGDFVVRRADGLFAYQLAVVVDDFRAEHHRCGARRRFARLYGAADIVAALVGSADSAIHASSGRGEPNRRKAQQADRAPPL